MPPEWEDDSFLWNENNPPPNTNSPFETKPMLSGMTSNNNKGMPTLRPPLYNAEDYTAALKQLFSSSSSVSVLIDHSGGGGGGGGGGLGGFSGSSSPDSSGSSGPPEMSMRKFLNGSELLFKLEADLRSAYPTFVQEFVSGHCEGIYYVLEALKGVQAALDDCTGLREQRKLILDEQKCLQCLKLCLRNIEAVSKLSTYPGGLYSLAAATISTVTATRIMAFEVLACMCTEGGADGHFKVSEAIATLRLRMGEPIRCKLLVGALSSAPPGTFQAKGIHFLTSWVASAPSPKQKVHIQCELEEAGFNPQAIRKGAELGGARESREVCAELEEWDRVSIDVDTLTRQNCQLRNSVATLQQELATLKDKLKRMDVPQQKMEKSAQQSKRQSRPKRSEELVTTPADSEEEAEQIHQILEDLNNIVNSEMNGTNDAIRSKIKKEKDIVPSIMVKSPPKRSPGANGVGSGPGTNMPRPWPGSSASDDDDSDILELCSDDKMDSASVSRQTSPNNNNINNDNHHNNIMNLPPSNGNSPIGGGGGKGGNAHVRRAVEQLEKTANNGPSPKLFQKNSKYQNQLSKSINLHASSNPNMSSSSPVAMLASEPKPDYTLPNFHKQNHMASKFANFKSSKLYSSSPDNSSRNHSNSYAEVYEKSSNNSSRYNFVNRFSPNLEVSSSKNKNGGSSGGGLRRSESLHTSLASIENERSMGHVGGNIGGGGGGGSNGKYHGGGGGGGGAGGRPSDLTNMNSKNYNLRTSNSVLSWKSMENLDNNNQDENFTLRWRYPHPQFQQQHGGNGGGPQRLSLTPSPKNSKGKTQNKIASAKTKNHHHTTASPSPGNGDMHLIADYRQNRFTKNSKANGAIVTHPASSYNPHSNNVNNSNGGGGGGPNLFTRYAKKSTEKTVHLYPQQQHQIPANINHNDYQKEKENLKGMFSLPPMLSDANHRICDLPSGLY